MGIRRWGSLYECSKIDSDKSMSIRLSREILLDPESALNLEWIDTNGLGGWSSSSVLGCNTRSYHGVLVSAVLAPVDRKVMLSRLDESISINNQSIALSTRDFGDTLYPKGFNHLVSFQQTSFPCWEFEIDQVKIRKTIICLQNLNSVCIRYELISESGEIPFSLEPFIAARDYHANQKQNDSLQTGYEIKDSSLILKPEENLPPITLTGPWTKYKHNPCWHHHFFYREEARRGLGDREDLLSSGILQTILGKNSPLTILISTEEPANTSPDLLYCEEIQLRERISISLTPASQLTKVTELKEHLKIASTQFIVTRGKGKTIIAGYHWFTDWGRDTLIAIRGLSIAMGKLDEAQAILHIFCDNVKDGLVPNRFVENEESAEYNTVDASLWLFIAAFEFDKAGGDREFTRQVLLPTLTKIYQDYSKGTRYQIKEDSDGLISAGNPHVQLTWMDAKIGDWVVTPRHGKAVEINALWFNALNILGMFADSFNLSDLASVLKEKAQLTQASFLKVFWNEDTKCLYDVVNSEYSDCSIRPNQIFAVGLPFPIINKEVSILVIKAVREQLLTPRGLRTLSPLDRNYRKNYSGSPHERDSAYHQGTVWPWLIGTYIDAIITQEPDTGLLEAKSILEAMHSHLEEAGIGSISEIFDGDFPHAARGTIAQAWSVSELLRLSILVEKL